MRAPIAVGVRKSKGVFATEANAPVVINPFTTGVVESDSICNWWSSIVFWGSPVRLKYAWLVGLRIVGLSVK